VFIEATDTRCFEPRRAGRGCAARRGTSPPASANSREALQLYTDMGAAGAAETLAREMEVS